MRGRGTRRLPAIVLALGLAPLASAKAQPADVGSALAAEDRRFAAMVAADLEALDALLDDGLVYVHTTGAVDTKESFLESLRSGAIRYRTIEPLEREARHLGDATVITGLARMRVSTPDRELAFAIRHTSVYARAPGGWRLVAWQSTRLPEGAP